MIKEKFAKLLSVKSIVTIILTAVFAYLALAGTISGEQFLTVFTVIIAFYFGTQHERKAAAAAATDAVSTDTAGVSGEVVATESASAEEVQEAAK